MALRVRFIPTGLSRSEALAPVPRTQDNSRTNRFHLTAICAVRHCFAAMQNKSLKIAVVDQNPVRAAILIEGLQDAGRMEIARIEDTTDLLAKIHAIDPDVILIDLEDHSRDVLEQMFQVSRDVRRPIAMFVDHSDRDMIEAAVEAGVSAYIVDGLVQSRVKSIVQMTISRFNAFAKLRQELEQTRSALEDRKVIDRAKGILMRNKATDEAVAYSMLRKTAMNEKRKIVEIARSVIMAANLLD